MNESRGSTPQAKWKPLLRSMVDELAASGVLRSPAIRRSFLEVPRHLFVDEPSLEDIYSDAPIVTKTDVEGRPVSSCSMPSLVASMLEDLDLSPGLRVMEVGAGTGYNAALLGHVVGASGRVVSIDIDSEVATAARHHELLSHLGEWDAMGRVALSDCRINMKEVSSGAARQGHGSQPGTVAGNAYDIEIRFRRINGTGLL